ncbi:MAG TPA: GTPase domain-containing protein [Kofleriaceae bacterium]
MAIHDPRANEIVIRVVYDGAPESGKTTSLRALAGSLAQPAVTPEEDATGRTLWFDWMEYVGGRFEGSRIRCQIVSVPGQRELDARRRALLAGADVVVAVVDTTADAFARSLAYLRELRQTVVGSTVGIVLQANKRDRADAIELEELRASLGSPSIGLIESIAADGTGIREAFVYAVRLALDRVRDLMSRSALATGSPAERSAADLLAALRGVEVMDNLDVPAIASDEDSVAAVALISVLEEEQVAATRSVEPVAGHVPRPPDASVPSGAIWPPVEGRAILANVAELRGAPHQFGGGDWVVGLGSGWRVVSRRDACFRTLDEGRAALIQWARLHAASASVISPRRCIVLSDAGDGSWRLWQIVRVEESLREAMGRALDEPTPELIVLRLCQGSKQLLDAVARIASSPCDLPCTLDSVGISGGLAVYIGLMPNRVTDVPKTIVVPSALLRAQLEPLVAAARIGERGQALQQVIDTVPRPVVDRDGIMSTLVALFA